MNISRRSFLKLAGLTTVAAASASMFTGCGSLKPVTIVYIYEGTDAGIKTKVENLNKDKTKTTYIPFMSSTDYAKGFVSSYLKGTGLVVDTDEGKTTYKVATEGENKGKLVVYVKVASRLPRSSIRETGVCPSLFVLPAFQQKSACCCVSALAPHRRCDI